MLRSKTIYVIKDDNTREILEAYENSDEALHVAMCHNTADRAVSLYKVEFWKDARKEHIYKMLTRTMILLLFAMIAGLISTILKVFETTTSAGNAASIISGSFGILGVLTFIRRNKKHETNTRSVPR